MKSLAYLSVFLLVICLMPQNSSAQWVVDGSGKEASLMCISPELALKRIQKSKKKPILPMDEIKKILPLQKNFVKGKSCEAPLQLQNAVLGSTDAEENDYETYVHVGFDKWFNQICMMDGDDPLTCDMLALNCGYKSCAPAAAITGLFGGCNGLLCGCTLDDGSTFGDAVGMGELGDPKCDKYIPHENLGATQPSSEYDSFPDGWPPIEN